ncbi:hypothetical protein QBC40DRAFT_258109 [Triangularia verruculosa]|uniref:Uncharacterized protein n=1 Tax=Triangularia verruculosa TaxID=2587418 RepID=A0AAN6XD02_9PEZI|nr:hypothetical protein QBC40DRAFT_258109 [Triangularia verruculosa]
MKGIFESAGIDVCLEKMYKLGTKPLDPSVKTLATSTITALHTKLDISHQDMAQDCRAMLAKAADMTWTFELEFVALWERFFSLAFEILEKIEEEDKKLQAILEDFVVLSETTGLEIMEEDWDIVSPDEVEEFEVVERPAKSC